MAYSIDPIQDNCYPGTTVLVNKLHIHDEVALQEAEALATIQAAQGVTDLLRQVLGEAIK